MVADGLDYVVGVDTHRDEHALALGDAATGAVLAQRTVAASAGGYAEAFRFAQEHEEGARVWALEGAGHDGAGLARYLRKRGETVLELGRSPRSERRRAARTTGSTPSAPPALPSEVSRCRGRARGSGARGCGCCWLPGAAPSTCAVRPSCSCAA